MCTAVTSWLPYVDTNPVMSVRLPHWKRMNTRSSSRQVVEAPAAMDSDCNSSVPSPCSEITNSSSPESKKEDSGQDSGSAEEVSVKQDGKPAKKAICSGSPASQDGGTPKQNGGSAVTAKQVIAFTAENGGSATLASPNSGTAAQGNTPAMQNGKINTSAVINGVTAAIAFQESGSTTQSSKTSTQRGSGVQSSGPGTHSCDSLASASAIASLVRDSSSFCGGTYRKRKANFSNEETETLVKNVVKHFSALYGLEALRTESTRRNLRRSQLWTQIQGHVNKLGYTPRSIDDLKHKWRDIRLDVKRKVTTKRPKSSLFDSRLTPMEELVASTIGQSHLDGEHDGMFHEPGLPRQSIFYPIRPAAVVSESSRGDRQHSLIAPKPEPSTPEISVLTPAILTTTSRAPAILTTTTHLNFIVVPPPPVTEERAVEITPLEAIDQKPSPKALKAAEEEVFPSLPAVENSADTAPCDSQSSMVSSPAGSVGQLNTLPDWGNEGSSDKTPIPPDQVQAFRFKMEDDEEDPGEGGSQEMDTGSLPGEAAPPVWQDGQEEWDQPLGSPHRSENAREDSIHSSASQDGTQTPGTDLPPRDGCSCLLEDTRTMWRTNMQRLLELEEQWDQLYHQELAMWEEERLQQREQRVQDRLLQQQLLGVLTDIRDELKQMREQRTASRENHAAAAAAATTTTTTTTAGPSEGDIAPQTSASSDVNSPESMLAAQANGDSAPCSPKSTESLARTAGTSSETWSPKSTKPRSHPHNDTSDVWSPRPTRKRHFSATMDSPTLSPQTVIPRSSSRPRGRPRKFPIEEYALEGHS